MRTIKTIGLVVFLTALSIFTLSLFLSDHNINEALIRDQIVNETQQNALIKNASTMFGKTYSSNFAFVSDLKKVMKQTQTALANTDAKLENWQIKNYLFALTKYSSEGPLRGNSGLAFLLSFVLAAIGALIYFLPDLQLLPGIKNNGIYHNPATRGIKWPLRVVALLAVIAAVICFAIFQSMLLLTAFLAVVGYISWVLYKSKKEFYGRAKARSASPSANGWLGIATGIYLISFYILLYFYPYYITNWVHLVDPISEALSGNKASQWFLYGFLYCSVMLVMGIRMFIKYRHNRYQLVRTSSILFFQLGFAFIIPEIMVRLNQPYMDLKNAWPLNYNFFTKDQIHSLVGQGSELSLGSMSTHVGTIMFVWGIALVLVVVPLMTYKFGKRWYCSWVCGCGGLAETLGDPYRQLSDKSVRAWKIERYVIHGVLVFAVIMTIVVLYQYLTAQDQFLIFNAYQIKSWYGFMIGSMFSGIVGTGFYPLMGNRVWCRFGCPLAAGMGLIQRFKSRFRITTNGGQCISCGNCSTYCEMGIDVRSYAQRGQNIVRASCVGCGICAAVCPRGVLRLENGSVDISDRITELKAIHIKNGELSILETSDL